MSTIRFTIEVSGKEYNCTREIQGKNVLTQTIHVESIGEGIDPDQNGNDATYQRISLIEPFARAIARIMIGKYIKRSESL